MGDTIHFDRKCIPAADYVVLEVINRNDKMEMDGILLAQSNYSNDRLGHYKVLEVGSNAAKEYGLKPGDFVVADRLAQTYRTEPVAIMKYVNVIALTDKDATTFSPLKDMVFVQDDANTTQDVDGILVANYNKALKIGKIVAMNVPDRDVPFKKGDKVMLVKGGDSFTVGSEHVFIYKWDMICAVVTEKSV